MKKNYLDFSAPAEFDPSQTVCSISIVDQSGSMIETDYPPNRLLAASMAIKALLHEKAKLRPKDKVGIVGFSDKSTRICSLTKASKTSKIINSLKNIDVIGTTDFVKGLETAGTMFEEEAGIQRPKPSLLQSFFNPFGLESVISRITGFQPHAIFLSDGWHNGDGNAILAANKLKQLGVVLDCIGIGGSPTDVDEDCLKAMASVGPDGEPRYRFIGDSRALIQDFQRMATLQVL